MSDQLTAQINHYTETLRAEPTNAQAWARRGDLYHQLGSLPAALADLTQAVAIKADYSWALAHRGECYWQLGRYHEALRDFDAALSQRSDYAWALAHRGATYYRLKQYQQALGDVQQAVSLQPTYAWAWFLVAENLTLLRRYDEAYAMLQHLTRLQPAPIPYWLTETAILLTHAQRYAEAVAACEADAVEYPADPFVTYCLTIARGRWQGLDAIKHDVITARRLLDAQQLAAPRHSVTYRQAGLAALVGDHEQALLLLAQSIAAYPGIAVTAGQPGEDDPAVMACHDRAWADLWFEPRFRAMVSVEDVPPECI